MKDAFDDLERDLRAAVRARRRRRLPSAPMLAVVAALALGGGGAVAATQIARDPDVAQQGAALAERAVAAVGRVPACRHARTEVANSGPLLPAITRALPALRGRSMTTAIGDGIRIRVRVRNGPGLLARTDPDACLRARRAKVRELATKQPIEIRTAAERVVARMRDTAPGLQTLSIDLLLPPGKGGLGVSFRLRPGDRVPLGPVAGDGHLTVGIAGPRAVRVRSGPRSARVVDGLYVIAARRTVRELAADGSVIRETSARVRGISAP